MGTQEKPSCDFKKKGFCAAMAFCALTNSPNKKK